MQTVVLDSEFGTIMKQTNEEERNDIIGFELGFWVKVSSIKLKFK